MITDLHPAQHFQIAWLNGAAIADPTMGLAAPKTSPQLRPPSCPRPPPHAAQIPGTQTRMPRPSPQFVQSTGIPSRLSGYCASISSRAPRQQRRRPLTVLITTYKVWVRSCPLWMRPAPLKKGSESRPLALVIYGASVQTTSRTCGHSSHQRVHPLSVSIGSSVPLQVV